jgi:ABC-2 type transport system permease protein
VLLRLRAAFRKELRQFLRARALILLVIYVFAEIANCAWALTMDLRDMPLLVVDRDGTSASRALGERFRIAPYFAYRRDDGGADPEGVLLSGEAALVLVIPPGFARALDRGEVARVQLLADGTYSNFAALGLAHASELVAAYGGGVQAERIERSGTVGVWPSVVNRVRVWYMPGLEYTHYQMVSMLATSAFLLGVLLPAAGIVREKEAGTIEQLFVSPLRPWEFVAAKLVPMGALMVVGVAIGLAEARFLFGTPVQGSLLLFFAVSILLLFAGMGLGAYVGAVTRNLQQTLLVTFALLFPMLFLSGTVVPVESMPAAMRWLTYLSPLRFYLPLAQGILFKGVGLDVLALNAAALAAYGLLSMALGVGRLRHALAA